MRASRGLNSASGGARLWTAQLTHGASPPPALRVRDCHPGEQQAQTLLRTLETSTCRELLPQTGASCRAARAGQLLGPCGPQKVDRAVAVRAAPHSGSLASDPSTTTYQL